MSTVSLVKAQLCCPLNPLRVSYYYREVRYATVFDELLLSLPLRHHDLSNASLSAICEVFKIEPIFIRSSLSALLSAGLLTIDDRGTAAAGSSRAAGSAAASEAGSGGTDGSGVSEDNERRDLEAGEGSAVNAAALDLQAITVGSLSITPKGQDFFKDKLVPGMLTRADNTFFYHPLEDDLCSHNVTMALLQRAAAHADSVTAARMAQFAQPGSVGDGLAVVNWYGLARALSFNDGEDEGDGSGRDRDGGSKNSSLPAWESNAASSWARGEAALPEDEDSAEDEPEVIADQASYAEQARTLLDDKGQEALRNLVMPGDRRLKELGHHELPHMEWFTDSVMLENDGIKCSVQNDIRVEPQIMSFELSLDQDNRLSVVSTDPDLSAWLERTDSSTVFSLITRPLMQRMVPDAMVAVPASSSARQSKNIARDMERFEALAARVRKGGKTTPADISFFTRKYDLKTAQVKDLFRLPDPVDGMRQLIMGHKTSALSRVLAGRKAVISLPSQSTQIMIARKKVTPRSAEVCEGEERAVPASLSEIEAAAGSLCIVIDNTVKEACVDSSLVMHLPNSALSLPGNDTQVLYTGLESSDYCALVSSSIQAIMGDDCINLPMVEAVIHKGPSLSSMAPFDRPGPAVVVWLAQSSSVDISSWLKGWSQLYLVELLRVMKICSVNVTDRSSWIKAATPASTWHELAAMLALSDSTYEPEAAAGSALSQFESRVAEQTLNDSTMQKTVISISQVASWLGQALFDLAFRQQSPEQVLRSTSKVNKENLDRVIAQDRAEQGNRRRSSLELPGGAGRGSAGMMDPDNSLSAVYSGISTDVITANMLEHIMLRLRISEFEEVQRYFNMISNACEGEQPDPKLVGPELSRAILSWTAVLNTFRKDCSGIDSTGLNSLTGRISTLMQKLNEYFEPYHAGERFAIVDTNYLIDNSDRLALLKKDFTIVVPEVVLRELDRKKFDSRNGSNGGNAQLGHAVRKAVTALEELDLKRSAVAAPQNCRDYLNSFGKDRTSGDDLILATALHYKLNDIVLYTADRILSSRAQMLGIPTKSL